MNGFVYVFEAPSAAVVKVGMSRDPWARLVSVRQGVPFDLLMWGYWATENPAQVERELHEKLSKFSVSGEWFKHAAFPTIDKEIDARLNHTLFSGYDKLSLDMTAQRAVDLLNETAFWPRVDIKTSQQWIAFGLDRLYLLFHQEIRHYPALKRAAEVFAKTDWLGQIPEREGGMGLEPGPFPREDLTLEKRAARAALDVKYDARKKYAHARAECCVAGDCPGFIRERVYGKWSRHSRVKIRVVAA